LDKLGEAAENELFQKSLLSFGSSRPSSQEELNLRKEGLRVYFSQSHGLRAEGVENASGLRSLKIGDSRFAVHGVQSNTAMTVNGATFTGGAAPAGTQARPVGYFVPLETKEGKKFFTGSPENRQVTFKQGDKHYTMFFPPGTTDTQIQTAIQNSRHALQRGLDPEAMSNAIGPKNLTDANTALTEASKFAIRAQLERMSAALAGPGERSTTGTTSPSNTATANAEELRSDLAALRDQATALKLDGDDDLQRLFAGVDQSLQASSQQSSSETPPAVVAPPPREVAAANSPGPTD
jgi:hypothetical protein